jgi:hypothetical protein
VKVKNEPMDRGIYVDGIQTTLSAPFSAQLNSAMNSYLPMPPPAGEFQEGDGAWGPSCCASMPAEMNANEDENGAR